MSAASRIELDAAGLRFEEREQVRVELVLVRFNESVRSARVDQQLRALDELCRFERARANRHDLVVIAVDDECRHVELLEILREVRFGKRLDAIECVYMPRKHGLHPQGIHAPLRYLCGRAIETVERPCCEVPVELSP